jgi:hypothetical protein
MHAYNEAAFIVNEWIVKTLWFEVLIMITIAAVGIGIGLVALRRRARTLLRSIECWTESRFSFSFWKLCSRFFRVALDRGYISCLRKTEISTPLIS